MMFNFEKFIEEIHGLYSKNISREEVKILLDLGDEYNRDTPIATGKRLELKFISFIGKKITDMGHDYSNQIIDYNQSIESGINIWIADNLKGKSSIFKIIEFALTGNNTLKQNIKKWITHIILCFKINQKEYTIHLNTEKNTLKGILYTGTIKKVSDLSSLNKEHILFEGKGQEEYQAQIQEFFFKQFSYYSLKWTQKAPQKDKNELNESNASWKTYFKSIYLESKDSNNLVYGDQGKKIFQMLLGLELTFPINRLWVKRDMLKFEKAKLQSYSEKEVKAKEIKKDALYQRLKEINNQILQFSQNNNDRVNINSLYNDYNLIIQEMNIQNNNSLNLETEIQKIKKELNLIKTNQDNTEAEIIRISKEIVKNEKQLIDLEEYIDVGIFFSNLDIKHCPSCNHSISENKKKLEKEKHKCPLCNEAIIEEDYHLDKEQYLIKIQELKKVKSIFENQSKDFKIKNENYQRLNKEILSKIDVLEKQKKSLPDTSKLNIQLKEIEDLINSEKEKNKPENEKKDKLIAEKAVIEYQLKELEKKTIPQIEDFDIKIEILSIAIENLNKKRFDMGEKILSSLSELMLNEVHEFGLNSITKIQITDKLDIQYKQDGEFVSFDNIAEGEQLRVKLALYLSLIQLDIDYNFGRHTRFLIIDSPGKEEGDAKYLEGLSTVLKNIEKRFGDKLQILIGTAERNLENVVTNQIVFPENTYVF